MLIPPPPIDIPVLEAMAAVPVAVCVIPDMPDMTMAVVEVIMLWPE
jgi:hypothetical protein